MKFDRFEERTYDHEEGWHINPDAGAADPERKYPYVDNGTGLISPERFFSPEFAKAEWERMWTKTWLIAGRVSDIPQVGDYFTFDIGPESFVVTRTGTGPDDIAAYYNVCQHRGNRLVHQEFGTAESFVCVFHSWEWNLDGSLEQITDRETFREEVIADNPPLTPVKCDQWGGFVFICYDREPPALALFVSPPACLNTRCLGLRNDLDLLLTLKNPPPPPPNPPPKPPP